MNSLSAQKKAFDILSKIFREGAYSNIALNSELPADERAYISRLVRGVCERNIEFDYVISRCAAKVKPAASLIIKIGLYKIRYMDIPEYAAVSSTVELCKSLGKSGISGFVNAVLRKSLTIGFPDKDNIEEYLSVKYSLPIWAVARIIKDYGAEFAEDIVNSLKKERELTHIRMKADSLKNTGLNGSKKTNFGYYVTHSIIEKLNFDNKHDFVVQGLASIYVCHTIKNLKKDVEKILDVCAAPGGKAVLLSELHPDAEVTACDIHPHRLKLIENYAASANTKNISVCLNDGTVYREDFEEAFDVVLCDVPCSGFGVLSSRADIVLKRKEEDIDSLAKVQAKILETSARYVKPGGLLVYSTCAIFQEENSQVADAFINTHKDFVKAPFTLPCKYLDISGYAQLLPNLSDTDGFFIAAFTRM